MRSALCMILLAFNIYFPVPYVECKMSLDNYTASDLYSMYVIHEAKYRATWTMDPVPFYGGVTIPANDGALLNWIDGVYALPSYLDMYEVTKSTTWTDRFVQRANQIVGYASFTSGHYGWPSTRYDNGVSTEYIVLDSGIAAALARFDYINTKYSLGYPSYTAVVNDVITKWDPYYLTDGTYPLNYITLYGQAKYWAGQSVTDIVAFVKTQFRHNGDGDLYWNYSRISNGSEDVNHGDITTHFIGLTRSQFTQTQLDELFATYMRMWRANGDFERYLVGFNTGLIDSSFVSPIYWVVNFDQCLLPMLEWAQVRIDAAGYKLNEDGEYLNIISQLLKHGYGEYP